MNTRSVPLQGSHRAAHIALTRTPAEAAPANDATGRMRSGRQWVLTGFAVAVVGIVLYCLASFAAGIDGTLGALLLENPEWLVGPALGIIGIGTLMWLVGSFMYLSAAMDLEGEEPVDVP